jgi:hypothetical protein
MLFIQISDVRVCVFTSVLSYVSLFVLLAAPTSDSSPRPLTEASGAAYMGAVAMGTLCIIVTLTVLNDVAAALGFHSSVNTLTF